MKIQTLFYRHVSGIALVTVATISLGSVTGCKQAEKLAADLNSRPPTTDSNPNPASFIERIELSSATPTLWSSNQSLTPLGQLNNPILGNQTLQLTGTSNNSSLIFQIFSDGNEGGGFEILDPHGTDLFRLKYSYTSTTKSFHFVRSVGNTLWLVFKEFNQYKIWGLDINNPSNPYVLHELTLSANTIIDFETQDGWLIASGPLTLERWNIQDLTQIQSLSTCQGLQEAQVTISNSNIYLIEKDSTKIHLLDSQCQKQLVQTGLNYSEGLIHFAVRNQTATIVGQNGAEVFNLQTQQATFDLEAPAGSSFRSADSENDVLIILTNQNLVSLWNTDQIQEIGVLQSYQAEQIKIQRSQQTYYLYGTQTQSHSFIDELSLNLL